MIEHLHRTKQGENKDHRYLGKETQNEIIHFVGSSITNNILLMMKSAKYYSIILDCTTDISKVEQMTVVVRFVQETRLDGVYDVRIREHFMGFLPVPDSSSSILTQVVLKFLQDKKILLCNMRGQGYDNGANMKGKKSGLQKRISDMNKRAFYVPCSSHSWNLVVNDAAMSPKYAVSVFSAVKSLYDVFSSSVRRWDVLKKYLPNLSLKPLSDTRLESRIDRLTPLRFQIGCVYDSLVQISEEFDGMTAHEATSLANEIKNYTFLTSLLIWYDVLLHISVVSKTLQTIDINVSEAVEVLEKKKAYFETCRTEEKFVSFLTGSKELATELELEDITLPRISVSWRRSKKPIHFTYEGRDETIDEPTKRYKSEFYYYLLDMVTTSLDEKFDQLKSHCDYFDFRYDIGELKNPPPDSLDTKCRNLAAILQDHESSDIDALELREELKELSTLVKPGIGPRETLKFVGRHNFFPYVNIALRILLTLPVIVASGKRSFSKLKMIKTYRSTMSQTRLNDLATISIDHELAEDLNYTDRVKEFAQAKVRMVRFV
ncbi:zinc finger MYM-type protein 1-like [Schistocerca nitens]|uniref:zinc finger MYM-type protein 1-like n=1 Tax=Schistocerca nitens TaxID=7011 RepID=UPI002118CBD8|nr:zinc finger MYM-type protein 1-like [Schistocerca nitens]